MILAALTIPPGFERSLPSGCACNSVLPQKVVPRATVSVDRKGTIAVNGVPAAGEALYRMLQSLHLRSPQTRLQVFADVRAPYGQVIRVIDAAKEAEITDVSFVE